MCSFCAPSFDSHTGSKTFLCIFWGVGGTVNSSCLDFHFCRPLPSCIPYFQCPPQIYYHSKWRYNFSWTQWTYWSPKCISWWHIIFTVYSIDRLICLFIRVLVCLFEKCIRINFHEISRWQIIFTVYSIDKLICLFFRVCLFEKCIPVAFHEINRWQILFLQFIQSIN